MVTTTNRDNQYHKFMLQDFIHELVAGISKLDFVGLVQVAAEFCRGNMGHQQAFGQLFLKLGPNRSIESVPLLQRSIDKFKAIGLQSSP